MASEEPVVAAVASGPVPAVPVTVVATVVAMVVATKAPDERRGESPAGVPAVADRRSPG
nr:hypothetical protein [Mycobacterium asiaticum]